jgi:hypothetical protein
MTARIALAVGALLVISTVVAAAPAYQLVVTAEDGHVMWRVPVRLGTPLVLAYTNSIYRAPTEELLVVTSDGFRLTEVRSTSEAVLQYNALHPPYSRRGAYVAAATHAELPGLLPLRIGQTGRQRLIVDGRTLPLFTAGTGTRVTLEIKRLLPLGQWLGW